MEDLDGSLKLSLYRAMVHIRAVEDGIVERYAEQEMRCPVHLCIGQEAAEAGSALALGPDDYVVSGHRAHGHYLARGGDTKAMLAEIYGKATGCAGGKGGSMHLIDQSVGFLGSVPIVGSTIPIGVGAALGAKQKGEDRVTMVYLGDGAVEAGVFHESAAFAVLQNLAVVFICENNLYSVYSPMEVRQSNKRTIAELAAAQGMAAARLDGNDVEWVYRATRDAVDAARSGEGPQFLELETYRWREHCGPNFDNDIGYRTVEEYEAWRKLDPVAQYQARLAEAGMDVESVDADVARDVAAAFDHAIASPFPTPDRAAGHVYGT